MRRCASRFAASESLRRVAATAWGAPQSAVRATGAESSGPSRRRGGLGLSAASSGALRGVVRGFRALSPRAAPPACGGRDAARAAGTRWRRLSGFGSLWRRGAHGPPAACRHAVSRAFDRCRWLRTSTRRVRRRGRRGQRSVIDRGRRLVPVMLAINATAPAARLRRRGVVRGRGTRPLNRLKPCPARRLLASNQSRHAGRPIRSLAAAGDGS